MDLKQSTSHVISFGPALDKTNGVDLEIGLVNAIDHATTGILLSKNGGVLTIRSQAVTASTYDAYGNYRVTLSTTDTNTLGTLRMQFVETATCLPIWQDFMVLSANAWDTLYGADKFDVNVEEWNTTAVPAEHTAGYPIVTVKDGAGTGEINTNAGKVVGVELVDTLTTYTGNTVQTGDAFARLGLPAGASVSADILVIDDLLDTEVAAIKAKTDALPASPAATGDAMTLTAGERNSVADALLDRADSIETGVTLRQAERLALAALAGKLSGAATTSVVIRNAVADSKNRITATVDSSGNRTAISTDLT